MSAPALQACQPAPGTGAPQPDRQQHGAAAVPGDRGTRRRRRA